MEDFEESISIIKGAMILSMKNDILSSIDRCKACGKRSLISLKKYSVSKDLNQMWLSILQELNSGPLRIRLSMCCHCGFVGYGDFFSHEGMKKIYAAEARYKDDGRKKKKAGNQEHAKMIDFLKRQLSGAEIQSVVDVGAGDFQALEQVRSMYPRAQYEAIDPSYESESYQGISIHRTMLEDFSSERSFDLVLLIHVLEHVGDTDAFLRKLATLTKTEGYLYVEVPFQVGPGLWLNRSVSAHHINYFSPATLRWILRRYGFAVRTLEFDKDAYLYNGMPGMIRVLAQRMSAESFSADQIVGIGLRGVLENIYYLASPLIYISTVGMARLRSLLR